MDIAEAAGVSIGTVSLAINDSPLVNSETKKKIKKLSQEMGYIPNEAARSLVRKKSRQFGVIIPEISNYFYSTFIKELNSFVHSMNYGLTISISDNNPAQECMIIDEMIRNNVEGVIIVPFNERNSSPEYINKLRKVGIPFLFAVDYYDGIDACHVISDLETGMYNLVKYLISLKYTDIAYLSGDPSVITLKMRENGYRRAVEEASLQSHIIRVRAVDYTEACSVIQDCIRNGSMHRVFVCPNDMMALGVINTLRNNGISVPSECAVTGFDNVIFSSVSSVAITTVEQNIKRIAEKSFRLLIGMLDGNKPDRKEYLIKTRLIKRDSC